jgi:hypothetical protein
MIDSEKQYTFSRLILGGVTLEEAKSDGIVSTSEEETGWIDVAKDPAKYGYSNETAGAWVPSWIDEWIAEFLPNHTKNKKTLDTTEVIPKPTD